MVRIMESIQAPQFLAFEVANVSPPSPEAAPLGPERDLARQLTDLLAEVAGNVELIKGGLQRLNLGELTQGDPTTLVSRVRKKIDVLTGGDLATPN